MDHSEEYYKIKYLKYKFKYLQLKEKLEGGVDLVGSLVTGLSSIGSKSFSSSGPKSSSSSSDQVIKQIKENINKVNGLKDKIIKLKKKHL